MKSAFFYGLFMDPDLLRDKGLNPSAPVRAFVEGYGLRIGERATLEASENECAFGTVMSLGDKELDALYSDETVVDYTPRQMVATDEQGNAFEVTAYILPMEKVSGSNDEYAKALSVIARKVGLPDDYIDEIKTWLPASLSNF